MGVVFEHISSICRSCQARVRCLWVRDLQDARPCSRSSNSGLPRCCAFAVFGISVRITISLLTAVFVSEGKIRSGATRFSGRGVSQLLEKLVTGWAKLIARNLGRAQAEDFVFGVSLIMQFYPSLRQFLIVSMILTVLET